MNPIVAAKGIEVAGKVAGKGAEFVGKHKKKIAGGMAVVVGAAGVAYVTSGRQGVEVTPGGPGIKQELVVEPPKAEIRKIEGVSLGCFVKQTTTIEAVAHDETNLNVSTPGVEVFGRTVIPSFDPIDNKTLADRTTSKRRTTQTYLCADHNQTEAHTTWSPVKDNAGNYVLKDPSRPADSSDDYVQVPTHVDVKITGLKVIGGILPDPSDEDRLDTSYIDNFTPGPLRYDNSNIHTTLDGVLAGLGMYYSCNREALGMAELHANKTFKKLAWDIGRVPENEVRVTLDNAPAPMPNWTEGRATHEELADKLRLDRPIPGHIQIDVGRTSCGAVLEDDQGQVIDHL